MEMAWAVLRLLPLFATWKQVYPTVGKKPETVMKCPVNRFRKDKQLEAPAALLYTM